MRPSFRLNHPRRIQRAQGRPGACRTHGPRATKSTRQNHRYSRSNRPSLREWFYGLYVISPVTRLCCHRCFTFIPQSVAPALGRQDHTTSPSASCRSSRDMPRPSHPAPNVRDDRDAPLFIGCGTGERMVLICPTTQRQRCATDWHDGQFVHGVHAPVLSCPHSRSSVAATRSNGPRS
jgi:hypothetical protein